MKPYNVTMDLFYLQEKKCWMLFILTFEPVQRWNLIKWPFISFVLKSKMIGVFTVFFEPVDETL